MNAAESIVSTVAPVPCCEPLEVDLAGSKDLRRILNVQRSRYGQITVYVRPQCPRNTKRRLDRCWFQSIASVSVSSYDAPTLIDIRYHKSGPSLWIGYNTWFDLLPAEAEELVAKFGFTVRRESRE